MLAPRDVRGLILLPAAQATQLKNMYTLEINENGFLIVRNDEGKVVPVLVGSTVAKSLSHPKGFSEVTITLLCRNVPNNNNDDNTSN